MVTIRKLSQFLQQHPARSVLIDDALLISCQQGIVAGAVLNRARA